MTELHLISHSLCPYVQRAVIVLAEKNVEFKRTDIDLGNKPDWFLELSPLGRVPVLQTQGAVLFESQILVEYLDEVTSGTLHPADALEKARHRSWIEFGSETLGAIAGLYSAPDAKIFEEKRFLLIQKFQRIEGEIAGEFFAGEIFHMVDGVWGTIFRYLDVFDKVADFELLQGSSKLGAWRKAVAARPSVIGAVYNEYNSGLLEFLRKKGSHISSMI